jgi:hypothetical protein
MHLQFVLRKFADNYTAPMAEKMTVKVNLGVYIIELAMRVKSHRDGNEISHEI